MTDNSPDLVQRAAARLQARRPGHLEPVIPAVVHEDARPTVPQVQEAAATEAILPNCVNGKHVQINLSPTTLAANGLVLPTSGFSRTREEFRALKRHVLSQAMRSENGAEQKSRRIILVTSARPGE